MPPVQSFQVNSTSETVPTLTLSPIGFIHTPFQDRAAAPCQPRAAARPAEGTIILNPGQNFEQALEDLAGFDYIWIISWFHKNKNWKPKVLPPRGSKIKRGLFATRSPHRPNPIGLSLARLISIDGRTIKVAETDLLDGTPILDLKPYLAEFEAQPDARAGWLESQSNVPATKFSVQCSKCAAEQLEFLQNEFGIDLKTPAERVLSRDAAPHPYRRISKAKDGTLQLAIKSWRIEFRASDSVIEIQRILSGYSRAALIGPPPNPIHEKTAHLTYHERYPNCCAP